MDRMKFYDISADIGKTINNRGKLLIISYTMKQEKDENHTMASIKLFGEGLNQKRLNQSTDYEICFGPNYGSTNDKRHFDYFMRFGNQTYQSSRILHCIMDKYTHMFTLIIRPNNTAQLLVDGKPIHEGLLREDFDVLGPRLVCFFFFLFFFFLYY